MLEIASRKIFSVLDTVSAALRSGSRSLWAPGSERSGDIADPASRFVPFESRAWASDLALSRQFLSRIQGVKWGESPEPLVHWKGIANIKDPYDLALVPLLLWELKPRTVIELGAYLGGSAIWMADQLEAMGVDAKIFSFDIDISRIHAKHARVQFLQGDCMKPETLTVPGLATLPRPWLVVEDAHINTAAVLEHFHPHLKTGDYLIVEDTGFILDKYRELERFMRKHADDYRVDRRYTDLFGYNATLCFNGYLKRV